MKNSTDLIVLNGGAFLVHDQDKGGFRNEIGWAYIKIHSMQTIEIGHIENTIAHLNKAEIPIKFIRLKQQIKPDQLNFVFRMCSRAFNTVYAYNFSEKNTYLYYAEDFFKGLN